MKKEFENCDKCKYLKVELLQQELMLGMDTCKMVHNSPCKESYDMVEQQLVYYIDLIFNQNKKEDTEFECINCKSKFRSQNSKKYFDKMINVVKNKEYGEVDKLLEIYKIEEEYFKELGGF